jgi:hypothetical protein
MKKFVFIFGLMGLFLFGFKLNTDYDCETVGFSFQKNGKVYNIPNNIMTNKQIQKDLGNLYEINFTPIKNAIRVEVGGKKDILPYIKTIKNKLDVYITKDKQILMFVDKNTSQIAIKIPIKQLVIYYKCKEK